MLLLVGSTTMEEMAPPGSPEPVILTGAAGGTTLQNKPEELTLRIIFMYLLVTQQRLL
jgi:hypothetical protein